LRTSANVRSRDTRRRMIELLCATLTVIVPDLPPGEAGVTIDPVDIEEQASEKVEETGDTGSLKVELRGLGDAAPRCLRSVEERGNEAVPTGVAGGEEDSEEEEHSRSGTACAEAGGVCSLSDSSNRPRGVGNGSPGRGKASE
jgi:hypothetical protein